jgi:hypothetical protein
MWAELRSVVEFDVIQINEKTLWIGGPGAAQNHEPSRPSTDFCNKIRQNAIFVGAVLIRRRGHLA